MIVPNLASVRWWVKDFKIKFGVNDLMVTVRVEWGWVPDLTDRLGCEVKIRSIHVDEFSSICVGSFIIWWNPNCDVILSTVIPSEVMLSLSCHWFQLALKSPRTTSKNSFSLRLNPGSFQKILQNRPETDYVIYKVQ